MVRLIHWPSCNNFKGQQSIAMINNQGYCQLNVSYITVCHVYVSFPFQKKQQQTTRNLVKKLSVQPLQKTQAKRITDKRLDSERCVRVVQTSLFLWGPQWVREQHRNLLRNIRGFTLFYLPSWVHKTSYIYFCVRCWSLTDCGPPRNTSLVVCTCLQNSL